MSSSSKHVLWLLQFETDEIDNGNITNAFQECVNSFNSETNNKDNVVDIVYIGRNFVTVMDTDHTEGGTPGKNSALPTTEWDLTIITNNNASLDLHMKLRSSPSFQQFTSQNPLKNLSTFGLNIKFIEPLYYYSKFSKFMSTSLGVLNKLNVFNINLFENNTFPCLPFEKVDVGAVAQTTETSRSLSSLSGSKQAPPTMSLKDPETLKHYERLKKHHPEGVLMLNLLKITDIKKDEEYGKYVLPLVFGVGGRPVMIATSYRLKDGAERKEWNQILLVYYPSGAALLDMITSKRYQAVVHFKQESVSNAFVQSTKPLMSKL